MTDQLLELVSLITRRWKPLLLSTGGCALLCALAILILWLVSPFERVMVLPFRVTFEGAEQGKYPNGMPFSGEELLAEPVLREVYRKQKMDSFGPFAAFREGFAVVGSNSDLERILAEAEGLLQNTNLQIAERRMREDEFRRHRDVSVGKEQYALMWRDSPGFGRPPSGAIAATLSDVLETWEYLARQRRRVGLYDMEVFSKNYIGDSELREQDYLITLERLRSKVVRLLTSTDALAKLPGGGTVRGGPRKMSLAELRVELQDALDFEIQPLASYARALGMSKPAQLRSFIESAFWQIEQDRREAQLRVQLIQQASYDYMNQGRESARQTPRVEGTPGLGGLPQGSLGRQSGDVTAIIPQIGDVFIDRLADASTKASDLDYRQKLTDRVIAEKVRLINIEKERAYYEEWAQALKRPGGAALPDRTTQDFQARFQQVLAKATTTASEIALLHEQLSRQNLDPQPHLYASSSSIWGGGPNTTRESGLSLGRLMVLSAFGTAGVFGFALAFFWWWERRSTRLA
jgi:hypothetical protein